MFLPDGFETDNEALKVEAESMTNNDDTYLGAIKLFTISRHKPEQNFLQQRSRLRSFSVERQRTPAEQTLRLR